MTALCMSGTQHKQKCIGQLRHRIYILDCIMAATPLQC